MATIWQKVRTLSLSNIHTLLDKAIDLNSIGAVKQHVRDLEEAKEDIADQAAVASARHNGLKKELADLRTSIKTTDENINLILSDDDESNDALAETLEARLMSFEQELADKEGQLEEARVTAEALNDATQRLSDKHHQMLSSLRHLEAMDQTAKAKERAAQAIRAAADAGSAGADATVDSVTARIQNRVAVADARFERAMGKMNDSVEVSVVKAQAQARLAARRAKLSGKTED